MPKLENRAGITTKGELAVRAVVHRGLARRPWQGRPKRKRDGRLRSLIVPIILGYKILSAIDAIAFHIDMPRLNGPQHITLLRDSLGFWFNTAVAGELPTDDPLRPGG
jgi:hypothetical protein